MRGVEAPFTDIEWFEEVVAAAGVIGIDCETTIDRVIKQKICTFQAWHEDGDRCLLRVVDRPDLEKRALRALERSPGTLIAHNAIFEQTQFLREGAEPRLHCTMLMAKVLEGEMRADDGKAQLFSLAALSERRLGATRDKKEQKRDWTLPLDDSAVAYAMDDARDAVDLWKQFCVEAGNADWSGYHVIAEALPAIAEVNLTGMVLDKVQHRALIRRLGEEAKEGVRLLNLIADSGLDGQGIANHGSPKQVSEWIAANLLPDGVRRTPRVAALLFAQVTEKHWRTSTLGFSLDKNVVQGVLREVEACSPLVAEYLLARATWMKARKLLEAFGESLLAKVDADGRVRTQIKPHGAKTSRTSAVDPNMQQMPAEPEFRAMFVAEVKRRRKLVICDYGQMELRVGAIIARDQVMMDVFRQGADIHSETAVRVFKFDASTFDPEDNPTHKAARKKAKAPNFAALYGAQAGAIAMATGLSFREASDLLEAWLDVYRGIARYREEQPRKAAADGYVQLASGQKIRCVATTRPAQAINAPVQGGCASVFYRAATRVRRRLRAEGVDALMAGLVHDEIILDAHEDHAERAAEILQDEMVGALLEFFPEAAELGMADLADAGVVDTWAEK